ncbi:hypothetical protein, partial [Zavarzinella formosa]|uniref:hypothetical protein n=1 Tax=Zavarzinella formosa TaxID=360055 RepID=UPI001EE668CD
MGRELLREMNAICIFMTIIIARGLEIDKKFDSDSFDHALLSVISQSRGKPFSHISEELHVIQAACQDFTDEDALNYVTRNINCRLFMFASQSSQPPFVVNDLYSNL